MSNLVLCPFCAASTVLKSNLVQSLTIAFGICPKCHRQVASVSGSLDERQAFLDWLDSLPFSSLKYFSPIRLLWLRDFKASVKALGGAQ